MGRNGIGRKFEFEDKRFENMVLTVYQAAIEGIGIFHGGYDSWKKRYMPEHRYAPNDPREASEYLQRSHDFERRMQSRVLHRRLKKVWDNPELRWFFKADKVLEHSLDEIEGITRGRIGYVIDNPPQRILNNARIILDEYGGDPRKFVEGVTVEEARNNLMGLAGIGTGIANMAILQFMHRGIVSPNDPENALFKIDVHKGRIPLNVGGINLTHGARDIHVEYLTEAFQQEYWRICTKYKLDPIIVDSALWVLGSEVCAKRSFRSCHMNCPLIHGEKLCLSNVPLTREEQDGVPAGRYVLFNKDGSRSDTRRKKHEKPQDHFLF